MKTRLSRCGGSSVGLRGSRDQIDGWPSVTRPSGPICGEENAVSEVVSVLRTTRAWWISPPKTTSTPSPVAPSLAATLTASTRFAGPSAPGRARRADRAGEDDRRLGVADDVAQHRRLLERVGAVRDDDAHAAPRARRAPRGRSRAAWPASGARSARWRRSAPRGPRTPAAPAPRRRAPRVERRRRAAAGAVHPDRAAGADHADAAGLGGCGAGRHRSPEDTARTLASVSYSAAAGQAGAARRDRRVDRRDRRRARRARRRLRAARRDARPTRSRSSCSARCSSRTGARSERTPASPSATGSRQRTFATADSGLPSHGVAGFVEQAGDAAAARRRAARRRSRTR